MKNKKLYKICLTGLFAAIITIFTILVKINTGINEGYIHLGDCMIYLAGCIVGPYAIIGSAIGGALADILSGAAVWALPTAIVKVFTCLPFVLAMRAYTKKKPFKIINTYTVLMTLVSGAVTVLGYLAAESILYSFEAAIPSIPLNAIQAAGNAVAFIVLGLLLDAAKIQKALKL